ncbi:hypothetical protein MHI61_11010 [Rhizobium sp. K102]|nr:hypothetical protein [Rhizobium sp. K102]ULR45679.1 hypothetical protein MHI61_11010 [Rhizobium sp. K102]
MPMRSLSPENSPGASAAGDLRFQRLDRFLDCRLLLLVMCLRQSPYFSASCASREARSSDELEDGVEAAELKTVDAELEIPLTMNMTFDDGMSPSKPRVVKAP